MFLTPSDFTGKYELHTGMYDYQKMQLYINKYEIRYLQQMFGVDLYNEFMSDLDSLTIPKSPNFLLVYNPFFVEESYFQQLESDGIIEMLKGFVYFEYSKDLMMQQTTSGGVQQTAENSVVLTSLQTLIWNRYNEAIKTYNAIQKYIMYNFNLPIGQVVTMPNLLTGNSFYPSGAVWTNAPIVFNKSVKKFTIFSTGIGYSNSTNVAVTGGSGTGMTVSFNVLGGMGGVIDSATLQIINRGSGYTANDLVQITGTAFTTPAVITINEVYPIGGGTGLITTNETWLSGAINVSNITNAGTGYAVGDLIGTIVTSGAVGSGAIIQVLSVSSLGAVLTYKFSDNGSGYANGSALQSNAGIGSGTFAIFVTSVFIGQIKSVVLSNIGQDFILGTVIGIPLSNGVLNTQWNAVNPSFNLYTITYVGKGKFNTLKGKRKNTGYWL